MQFSIKTTGIVLTDAIDAYVREKFGKLEKYITVMRPEDVIMHVEVGKTTGHHKKGKVFRAEVRLRLPGVTVFADAEGEELYEAIDLAAAEARRQIVQNKEKKRTKRKSSL